MKCSNMRCGHEIHEEWAYCPYCGAEVIKTENRLEQEIEPIPDGDLPPFALLDEGISIEYDGEDQSEALVSAYNEFGVDIKIVAVKHGPLVTRYEVIPGQGVRVERLKALEDNLALKLGKSTLRFELAIAGSRCCAVEVPKSARNPFLLSDVIQSHDFRTNKYILPLALGKDSCGENVVLDLSLCPHILIAGESKSGKTTLIHSFISGLLMRHDPNSLRLILVDYTKVDFPNAYKALPYLAMPVVTEAAQTSTILRWLVEEMERRFHWFMRAGVRNIQDYNLRDTQSSDASDDAMPEKLPYLVLIIDELADLMAVSKTKAESSIARLAAKSALVGIHMIFATQRPDVKVVTGTIKANFPVRIAFKVMYKHDSRTVLDYLGAGNLLKPGDMLCLLPHKSRPVRVHGAYVSAGEIERIVSFCRDKWDLSYTDSLIEYAASASEKKEQRIQVEDNDDVCLEPAIEIIRQTRKASTSMLQRRLRIGYARAAKIMGILEGRGIVGPPTGTGPRDILINLDDDAEDHK